MFELSCSLTSDLWPKLTKTKKINKLSSNDKVCVKFGKGRMATALGDHFNIQVADVCNRDKFDLIVSFSDEMPAPPRFVTTKYPQVTHSDKLKDVKMLVQCPDGCLPMTTSELICKIERGKKPKKCLTFYLEQENAFYGEFSLCDKTKVGEVGRKDQYLRCKPTKNGSDWVELQLTTEVLTSGKVCLKLATDATLTHVTDGNCSSNAEIAFFK